MAVSKKESFSEKLINKFNMLWFIMALGFGGTSVAGFAFLNNTLPRTTSYKGMLYLELVSRARVISGRVDKLSSDHTQHEWVKPKEALGFDLSIEARKAITFYLNSK